MPTDNSLRLHDEERLFPSRPQSPQHHPKQPIWRGETRLRMFLLQDCKLLPQCQVFQEKVTTSTKEPGHENEQKPHRAKHRSVVTESRPFPRDIGLRIGRGVCKGAGFEN